MPHEIPVVLTKKVEVASDTFELFFSYEGHRLSYEPGQYVWLIIPLTHEDPRGARRAFSITSAPSSSTFSILLRSSKSGYKQSLLTMPLGAKATISGPHGSLFADINPKHPVIYVAGGVGVAPFLSRLRSGDLKSLSQKTSLIYINSHSPHAAYLEELEKISHEQPHFTFVSTDHAGARSHLLDVVAKDGQYVIIGPPSMCESVASDLLANNIKAEQLIFEEFYPHPPVTPTYKVGQTLETYKLAVDSSTHHIVLTDPDGIITYANPAAETITGYTAQEMQGHTPRLWGGQMDAEFYKKLWHTVKIECTPFVGEIRNRRKNGQEYLSIARISPIIHEGVLCGFVGTEEDITPLKKAEAALEHQTTKLLQQNKKDEAILSSIGDAVIVTDQHLNVTLVNESATKLLGYNLDELSGKPYTEMIVALDLQGNPIQQEDRLIHRTIKEQVKLTEEMTYVKKDKTQIIASITSSPIVEGGTVVGVVQVIRDVTREKEVDRMKTEFISLASHQLRTPLSAMRWFAEMLLEGDAGKLNKEQQEFVQNISDSNDRMIALVNSLLNISRIESGRIIIEPKPTDMKKLAEDVVTELQLKIKTKKQKVIVSAHEELPYVMLDGRLIREVFSNLLSNAIKYTPEKGEIVVFISKKSDEVVTQVSDNGYGIPEKDKDKVFEKFYRGENIVKIETDGTGLGLYLAKAIVTSSGGKIWFESEVGVGTTFWFSLPLAGMIAKKGEVALDS